jgi:hypothetical protein
MSTNVTHIGPPQPPTPTGPDAFEASEAFDALYDRMQEQLDALRCVQSALEASEARADDELGAAIGLFSRTYRALNALHDDFASWHMKACRP